jgi:hypothetical protein
MHMEGPGNATGVPIKLFIQPAERERDMQHSGPAICTTAVSQSLG